MFLRSNVIVFPEGDIQEIQHTLQINQIVDLNGVPLHFPLPTPRMIAYRVYKIKTNVINKGEEIREHYLELIPSYELEEYV